jgi:hypothetical protein
LELSKTILPGGEVGGAFVLGNSKPSESEFVRSKITSGCGEFGLPILTCPKEFIAK